MSRVAAEYSTSVLAKRRKRPEFRKGAASAQAPVLSKERRLITEVLRNFQCIISDVSLLKNRGYARSTFFRP
jgi:hypothetical protein